MSFQIVITEKRTAKQLLGKEWTQIDTEEVERERQYYHGTDNEPKTRIKPVFGYTPEVEKTIVVEREVLKQTVDELDLAAVIKAINKL